MFSQNLYIFEWGRHFLWKLVTLRILLRVISLLFIHLTVNFRMSYTFTVQERLGCVQHCLICFDWHSQPLVWQVRFRYTHSTGLHKKILLWRIMFPLSCDIGVETCSDANTPQQLKVVRRIQEQTECLQSVLQPSGKGEVWHYPAVPAVTKRLIC